MARVSLVALLAFAASAFAGPISRRAGAPTDRGSYKKYTINPTSTVPPNFGTSDAPFSNAENTLYNNIICHPSNNSAASTIPASSVTNPFLLAPGTGATGEEAYNQGYVILLGNLGFQACTISPPPYMLGDLQVESEYVAYASVALSTFSGKQVPIISWSAGGPTTQWALTFWYSSRGNTAYFIPFAADFQGTTQSTVLNQVNGTTSPSVHQQTRGSKYLAAFAQKAKCSWVPTTSILSNSDEVVQPEQGQSPVSTSYLGTRVAPVSLIVVTEHCPIVPEYDHAEHLWNAFTYSAVAAAIKASNKVAPQTFTADCSMLPAPGLTAVQAAGLEAGELVDGGRIADPQYFSASEPPVKSYVSSYANVTC